MCTNIVDHRNNIKFLTCVVDLANQLQTIHAKVVADRDNRQVSPGRRSFTVISSTIIGILLTEFSSLGRYPLCTAPALSITKVTLVCRIELLYFGSFKAGDPHTVDLLVCKKI